MKLSEKHKIKLPVRAKKHSFERDLPETEILDKDGNSLGIIKHQYVAKRIAEIHYNPWRQSV